MKYILILMTMLCAVNGPTIPDNYPPRPSEGANGPLQPKGNYAI